MTARPRWSALLLGIVSALLLAGCETAPATASSAAKPAAKPAGDTVSSGVVPELQIGLTAAAITEKLGRPAAVEPTNPPEKMAEVWIYHIEGPVRIIQVVTGMKSVPAAVPLGFVGEMRMVDEPIYSTAEQRTTVTLELLMINGRLAAQKAKSESRNQYK
jgi:hypothetical protein